MMKSPRIYWRQWAATLRRYQLHEFTASLLEAGGPLTLLAAQALYFGRGYFGSEQLTALAVMLEQDDESRAFAAYLTQETRG
jgi:hypothetical protein